jgi:hypothetical protein
MASMWIRATSDNLKDSTQVTYPRIWNCPFYFFRFKALEIYAGRGRVLRFPIN